MEAVLVLLDELSSKDKRACLELLIRIFGNVTKNPDEPKYRLGILSICCFHADI